MCTQLKVHAIARVAQPAGAQEHAVLKGPRQVAIAWVMVLRILPPQALLTDMADELLLSSCYLLELLLAKIIWMLSSAQVTFHILLPSFFVLLLLIILPSTFVILLILLVIL